MTANQIRHLQNLSRLLTEAKEELVKCELPRAADLEIGAKVMAAAAQVRVLVRRGELQNKVMTDGPLIPHN